MPANSQGAADAAATTTSAMTSSPNCASIRRRRSSRSPSGTTSNSASALPSWVAVTMMPTAASSRPNSRPMASSRGCA